MKCLVFFVAAVLVASQCHGASFRSFPLSMTTGYGDGASDTEVRCASWRLAVEAQNIFGFETIPQQCVDATANYIEGGQYRSDSKTVNQQIYFFARDRHVHENDVILFNIDGTALSNIPYYSQHGYGYTLLFSLLFFIYYSPYSSSFLVSLSLPTTSNKGFSCMETYIIYNMCFRMLYFRNYKYLCVSVLSVLCAVFMSYQCLCAEFRRTYDLLGVEYSLYL